MKDNLKNTPRFESINSELDKAIDQMDILEIEKQLEKLSEEKPLPYSIEDSKIFAKRIIEQNKKGYGSMRRSVKKSVILVACIVLTIGVTVVYGTDLFKNFKFYNQETTVEIRTNQNISEEEAASMAKEAEDDYNSPSTQGTTEENELNKFANIKEVEESIGIKITLPSYVPQDFEMKKDILVQNSFDNNHNIYISYMSKEKKNRLFEVSIITQKQPEDSTIVTVTDTVHEGEYKTPSGTKYSILKEDEGIIATTDINNIVYSLIFTGVNEEEMHKVINSVDLSGYMMYGKQ
ncbi:hypothetical protein [Tepidibacter hydrothermalis]|uniref:DUF4367 domain-containing protein n=1 Tax=Tepidibacter hydrothermalis TaxID=3036126 RepID=A0ABY8EDA9_9FIRM|nr:hypothetical protein [Tepidibacter hydrothermalis]WFD10916.1 hypothetical protein P4S50_02255 [Tepidibacter hydrothermalis]